jgi:hypothetical protein
MGGMKQTMTLKQVIFLFQWGISATFRAGKRWTILTKVEFATKITLTESQDMGKSTGLFTKPRNERRKKSTEVMRDQQFSQKHLLLNHTSWVVARLRTVITVQMHHTESLCK